MRERIGKLIRASGAFGRSLLRSRAGVTDYSANGFSRLEGWGRVPEEDLIARCRGRQGAACGTARMALVGITGPHAGETFLLRGAIQTVGQIAGADVVITPVGEPRGNFQFVFDRGARLVAAPGGEFRLNGSPVVESELYDYDDIELLGNRFLVMQLGGTP